jgi:hypothetical protein
MRAFLTLETAALRPDRPLRLALRDHLAEGDLRRIRKRGLQLLVPHQLAATRVDSS